MSERDTTLLLNRQLLLQLGDRLRQLRVAQGIRTVEMAARVGITRNTLRAVESGDPATSIGTYVRVMSALGVSGELALLASATLSAAPAGSAATRSRRRAPAVKVEVLADPGSHQLQDLQSQVLHDEAVRLVKADPDLRQAAKDTVRRWLETGDPRSAPLWQEWLAILTTGTWSKVLRNTRHAQQLRQASPLVTVLPRQLRQRVLDEARQLKSGMTIEPAPLKPEEPTP